MKRNLKMKYCKSEYRNTISLSVIIIIIIMCIIFYRELKVAKQQGSGDRLLNGPRLNRSMSIA